MGENFFGIVSVVLTISQLILSRLDRIRRKGTKVSVKVRITVKSVNAKSPKRKR